MQKKQIKEAIKDRFSKRLAAVGAVAAYTSMFLAFFGFVELTLALLASSLVCAYKAVGTRRIKEFLTDLIGTG